MIVFGVKAGNIGNFDISGSKCDYCGQESSQRISVFGKYAHIFWIPVFPVGKKAIAECTHCKRTIEEKNFPPILRELYKENKSKAKRPFWHWAGLGLLGLLVAIMSIAGITKEEDPRDQLLRNDIMAMNPSPTMESDSISYKIKKVFDSFANEDINPGKFEYLTTINGDKALILVKIPNLKKVKKEARTEALEMIEVITNEQEDLKNKDKYIGVHGTYNMMLIKTPTDLQNNNIVSENSLYEFYGPKTKE